MHTLFDGITALFFPTPQEHLNRMWKIVKTLPESPPPRHVRVHVYLGWHPGCDETEFVMRHSALVGDFPLDRAGRLALKLVRARWTLRGCAPIDPCRRAKFDTVHPEYSSPPLGPDHLLGLFPILDRRLERDLARVQGRYAARV